MTPAQMVDKLKERVFFTLMQKTGKITNEMLLKLATKMCIWWDVLKQIPPKILQNFRKPEICLAVFQGRKQQASQNKAKITNGVL